MPGGPPAPAVLLGCGFSKFRQNTSEPKCGLEMEVLAEKINMSNSSPWCVNTGDQYIFLDSLPSMDTSERELRALPDLTLAGTYCLPEDGETEDTEGPRGHDRED